MSESERKGLGYTGPVCGGYRGTLARAERERELERERESWSERER
jgi:hypothetical protein